MLEGRADRDRADGVLDRLQGGGQALHVFWADRAVGIDRHAQRTHGEIDLGRHRDGDRASGLRLCDRVGDRVDHLVWDLQLRGLGGSLGACHLARALDPEAEAAI